MKKTKKPKLPRAPLPRQTGGVHKNKKKSDPKHKERVDLGYDTASSYDILIGHRTPNSF